MNDTDLPAPSGTPYAGTSPYSGRTDLTPDDQQMLADRFKNAAVATPGYSYIPEHVAPATGWYTVPGFVRVAVWLWALVTVLGLAAGLLFSLVWVIILMLTLGAQ